ncbi:MULTISPECIES: glycosyltransferase family 2 protein [Chitinophagaceae]
MTAEVEILLSTYNGEKYLAEQLDSILGQTYGNFSITIRDDHSTDGTLAVIQKYISKYPAKISLYKDPIWKHKNMGSTFSFGRLMQQATGRYLMFCDQDDVWMEDKIAITLTRFQSLEAENPNTPILVFTDMKEVDEQLKELNPSFIHNQKLLPDVKDEPLKVLAMNVVAGCTTMFNKQCVDVVLPFPSKKVIHDHWMAINVSQYGVVDYINRPTLYYRQHSHNVVGANKIGLKYFLSKLGSPARQLGLYNDLIYNLNFKINVFKFIYYKTTLNIKRLFAFSPRAAKLKS